MKYKLSKRSQIEENFPINIIISNVTTIVMAADIYRTKNKKLLSHNNPT